MKPLRLLMLCILLVSFPMLLFVTGEPGGVTIVSNDTETPTPQSAASLTTAGGSFTTLLLNATTQTLKWKAYVGNISGSLTLDDALNFSIYDWDLVTVSGEVYASRNNTVNWGQIGCVQDSTVTTEQLQLNITTSAPDSINRTFNNTIHRGFYVGTTLLLNSTCRAIATYVNDTVQIYSENASFQEIALEDNLDRFVYATILEDTAQGYNNEDFDFQMIVAENPTQPVPSTYYFWAELT